MSQRKQVLLLFCTIIMTVHLCSSTFLKAESATSTREQISLDCYGNNAITLEKPVPDSIEVYEKTTVKMSYYPDTEWQFYVCDQLETKADYEKCNLDNQALWSYEHYQTFKNYNFCGEKCQAFKKEWADKCAAIGTSSAAKSPSYQLLNIDISCRSSKYKAACEIDARGSETYSKKGNWKLVGIYDNYKDTIQYRWRIYPNVLDSPIRVNPVTLGVECFSYDGNKCLTGYSDPTQYWNLVYKNYNYKNAKPVSCGTTDYNNAGHWCRKAKDLLLG